MPSGGSGGNLLLAVAGIDRDLGRGTSGVPAERGDAVAGSKRHRAWIGLDKWTGMKREWGIIGGRGMG